VKLFCLFLEHTQPSAMQLLATDVRKLACAPEGAEPHSSAPLSFCLSDLSPPIHRRSSARSKVGRWRPPLRGAAPLLFSAGIDIPKPVRARCR
jgi:hypothetical protein